MRPLIATLPHALAFWAAFVWAFAPEFAVTQRADRSEHSLRVLLGVLQVAMLAAFFVTFATRHGRIAGQWVFWTGIALLGAGSLLRRYCFRLLGKSFTGHVTVAADQEVVDRGPYRFVRHPSYTGGLVMFIGIGLALMNWWSVGILTAGALFGYLYRIRVEERALLATLGPRYAQYAAGRKRLIPFVITL